MKTIIKLLVLCIIFSCQNSKKSNAKNEPVAQKKIENLAHKKVLIDSIIQEKIDHDFWGNILVMQHGQIIAEKWAGLANMQGNIPNTKDTRFQLASITKTFTAIGIMQLVEQQKLKLTDTVDRFFPDFPYPNITIFSLLTHRSGLPFYQYTFDEKVRKENLYPLNSTIMQWLGNTLPVPPKFNEPDRFFSYNNTNFLILASIIEKVSGLNYATYMSQHIFKPLGMSQSFVVLPNTDLSQKNIAKGHQWGHPLAKDYYDFVYGDKGIYTTMADLVKYYKGLTNNKLLKQKTLNEMWQPRSFEKKGTRNYGYGFRLKTDENNKVTAVFHTGWWKGFNTIFYMIPNDGILVIALGNKYSHADYDIKSIINVLQNKPVDYKEVDEENDGE